MTEQNGKTIHKILLPLPLALWERIKAEAGKENRTVNNWIWTKLEETINQGKEN
jgi:predicted HicB family RNase H-like nuclease